MNTKPKVSIIVPIYGVEKYLHQCVDSILAQTLSDIEIILVDDGSPDSCPEIIDDYARKDKRVVAVHQPNGGYGVAVNHGIELARGEYIGIIESDDWIDRDMFASLVKIADETGVDVVKSNFYEYTTSDGEKSIKQDKLPIKDCNCIINPSIHSKIFWVQPCIWSAIYRREFLNNNNIRCLETAGASYQDVGFNFKVWIMAQSIYLTPNAYVHYRCDNITASVKSSGKVFCVCDEWAEIDRYLSAYPDKKEKARKLIPHIKLGNYLWNLNRLTDDARNQFLARFQAEFSEHIKNDGFSRKFFDDKFWCGLMRKIYPKSLKWRFQKHFFDIIRPIYKTRVRSDYKIWYILNIRVKCAKLPTQGVF